MNRCKKRPEPVHDVHHSHKAEGATVRRPVGRRPDARSEDGIPRPARRAPQPRRLADEIEQLVGHLHLVVGSEKPNRVGARQRMKSPP
jgi:hypothetical protein